MAYIRIPNVTTLVFDALEDALEIYKHIRHDYENIEIGVGKHQKED